MMNLGLLFKGYEITGNLTYYNMAIEHCYNTLYNHFRSDYSTYHVVEYNQTDGTVIARFTAQGYSNSSCWSRGQSWAIYGYTQAFRYSNNWQFAQVALNAAKYYIQRLTQQVSDHVTYCQNKNTHSHRIGLAASNSWQLF